MSERRVPRSCSGGARSGLRAIVDGDRIIWRYGGSVSAPARLLEYDWDSEREALEAVRSGALTGPAFHGPTPVTMKAPFHVAACALMLAWIGSGSAAAQKPVTTLITRPTPFPPPSSTELLWKSAEAVVRGRVIGSTVRERRPGSAKTEPVLATDYSLHVDEVLKQSDVHTITGSVSVRHHGGEMEYSDRILINKEDGFPPLDRDAVVIPFLKWSPPDESYVPLAGPDAVFLDSAGIVRSPGRSAMARSNAGKPAKQFVDEIRAIAKLKKSPAP